MNNVAIAPTDNTDYFSNDSFLKTNEKKHILVVEDDRSLAEWVCEYLTDHGYLVTLATRGDEAIHLIESDQPDLVLLDLMLPEVNGFDICKKVRPTFSGPILMLTACNAETDEVLGLELGADDFLSKPVKPRILLARLNALLRRKESHNTDDILTFGTLSINRSSQTTSINNRIVPLSSNEFDMLWFLASHAGTILDRDSLVKQLRGIEYDGFDRSIDIGISRLRRKLDDNAQHPYRIKTIRGKGYLFAPDAWA